MNLLETVVEANQRRPAGQVRAELLPDEFRDALPLVALTCIDARLNHLFPDALGLPEKEFIWLRNAGNIITGATSSTMRSLALACAVKGGREIAVIGHTDCLVCKTSVLQLTDRFKALGVDRARLPENLNEFFGLFASERQNVLKAVETVRNSPLIGPRVPVHGLLMEIPSGRLEWLVNGYTALDTVASQFKAAVKPVIQDTDAFASLPEFKLGEMKFPDARIGESIAKPAAWPVSKEEIGAVRSDPGQTPVHEHPPQVPEEPRKTEPTRQLDKLKRFRIIGTDQKQYGPVTGAKVLEWIADGRIDWKSPAQLEGTSLWKPLASFVEKAKPPPIPIPPAISSLLHLQNRKPR